MSVIVREIKTEDYQQTIELIQRTITESMGAIYPKELIAAFCRKYDLELFIEKVKEVRYFIAEDGADKRIRGVIGLKGNELRTFFVDPAHQRKGIGRALFARFMQEVQKRGIREVVLEGSPLGEPVYTHFGFVKTGTVTKERNGIHYTDAVMKKTV